MFFLFQSGLLIDHYVTYLLVLNKWLLENKKSPDNKVSFQNFSSHLTVFLISIFLFFYYCLVAWKNLFLLLKYLQYISSYKLACSRNYPKTDTTMAKWLFHRWKPSIKGRKLLFSALKYSILKLVSTKIAIIAKSKYFQIKKLLLSQYSIKGNLIKY